MDNAPASNSSDASIFVRVYEGLRVLWHRRHQVVLPALILPIVGLGVGLALPQSWSTHTTILIQEASKVNPFMKDFTVKTNLKERISALDALLHSRHILNEVVVESGLVAEDADAGTRADAVADLSDRLSVSLIGAELIRIDLSASTAEELVPTLDAVAERFVQTMLAPERSTLESSETFLAEQLDAQHRELLIAETRLARYRQENIGALPENRAADSTRLQQLETAMVAQRTEVAGLMAQRDQLRDRLAVTNPMVGALEKQIVDLSAERALLAGRYTDEHSSIQRLDRRLERLQGERAGLLEAAPALASADLDRMWNLASTLPGSEDGSSPLLVSQLEAVEANVARVRAIESEIEANEAAAESIRQALAETANVDRVLTELERELATRQRLYDDLLHRHEMAQLTGALGRFGEGDRIQLIDVPMQPLRPANLPAWIFAIAGFFGGLIMGVGVAIVSEVIHPIVRSPEMVAKALASPVVAEFRFAKESKA